METGDILAKLPMRLATQDVIRLPNHSIQHMASVLLANGGDPYRAADAAQVAHAVLDTANAKVSGKQERAYQRAFFEQTADRPDIWIELGSRYRLLSNAHSFCGLALMSVENLQDAFVVGVDLADLHFSEATGICLFENGRLSGLRLLYPERRGEMHRFFTLRDLASCSAIHDEMWGGVFPTTSVEVAVERSDEALVRSIYPDIDITFGAPHTAHHWDVDLRKRRVAGADPVINTYYRSECEAIIRAAADSDDVITALFTFMQDSEVLPSLPECAQQLHMTPRTLQRALSKAGHSFRKVYNHFQHQKACRLLLESTRSIGEISWELGYDSASSFSSAFRLRSGLSPREYRLGNGVSIEAPPSRGTAARQAFAPLS